MLGTWKHEALATRLCLPSLPTRGLCTLHRELPVFTVYSACGCLHQHTHMLCCQKFVTHLFKASGTRTMQRLPLCLIWY